MSDNGQVTITINLGELRFIISELKQQEAFYSHRRDEAFKHGDDQEAEVYRYMSNRVGDLARKISTAIEKEIG